MQRQHSSNISSTFVSAFLVASVTIALGWPSRVHAVGDEEQAASEQSARAQQLAAPPNLELRKNEARIADLSVTADLTMSETQPGRPVIRLECHNPTTEPIAGTIQLELTRTDGNAQERVMPAPKVAWRHPQAVAVEAGGSFVREIPLPKQLASQVASVERTRKAAEEGKSVSFPSVYFGVSAEPVDKAQPRPKAKNSRAYRSVPSGKLSRISLASNALDFGY